MNDEEFVDRKSDNAESELCWQACLLKAYAWGAAIWVCAMIGISIANRELDDWMGWVAVSGTMAAALAESSEYSASVGSVGPTDLLDEDPLDELIDDEEGH